MHVIVENMRSLLLEHETKIYDAGKQGRIFGQLTPTGNHHFFRGGAGYTIDRVGLKRLHDYMPKCATKTYGPWEDNIISKCAWDLRLTFSDNRDSCSGQQRSHTENPGVLFNAQGLSQSEIDKRLRIWASLPHPIIPTREVGLKVGLDAASNHSVTFHRLHYPPWMVRHHALLYHACPSNTPLGNFANEKGDSITAGGAWEQSMCRPIVRDGNSLFIWLWLAFIPSVACRLEVSERSQPFLEDPFSWIGIDSRSLQK